MPWQQTRYWILIENSERSHLLKTCRRILTTSCHDSIMGLPSAIADIYVADISD